MRFKSGVQHEPLTISDKETAQAMMDTLKNDSGLFKADLEGSYIAPHHCNTVPTGELMTVKDNNGKPVRVKSYTVTSKRLDGTGEKKIRHFMAQCSKCKKIRVEGVIV